MTAPSLSFSGMEPEFAVPEPEPAPATVPAPVPGRPLPRCRAVETHYVPSVWVLTLAACVLSVGWAGALVPGWSASEIVGMGDETSEDDSAMVEVIADEQSPATSDLPPDTAEEPPVPEEALELPPEPVPVLETEDVFPIPSPPELVKPLSVDRPPPPERPRPQPQPRPATPRPSRPANAKPGPPSPARGPVAGTGGAGSGPAKKGKKAKTPQPPYPGFARSGKMTGTVVVSIVVDDSGSVVSASVARSCGFTQLDSYTCNYIRRSWRWPEGGRRSFTQPVSFRLR